MDLTNAKLVDVWQADCRLVGLQERGPHDVPAVLNALACLWPNHRASWHSNPEDGLTGVTLWTNDGYGVQVVCVDREDDADAMGGMMYNIWHMLPLACFSPLFGDRQYTTDSPMHEDPYGPVYATVEHAGNAVQAAWSLTEQVAGGNGELGERYQLRWLYAGAPTPNLTGGVEVAGLLVPNHMRSVDLRLLNLKVVGLEGRMQLQEVGR
jgi:hypothetical protein